MVWLIISFFSGAVFGVGALCAVLYFWPEEEDPNLAQYPIYPPREG